MNTTSEIPILPPFVIFIVLGLGLFLLIKRPYSAYLFSIVLPICAPMRTMTFTRLPLGPYYFNLFDVTLGIGLLAMVVDCGVRRQSIRVRGVVLAMLAVLAIGFANTTIQYGWSYYTVRALRWGLNIPLYFLITDNILHTDGRRRRTFWWLLYAVVAAELQHLLLVLTSPILQSGQDVVVLRTTAFLMAHSEIWLVVGPYLVEGRIRKPYRQLSIALMFLAAGISHQTRSIAFAFLGSFLLFNLWFARRRVLERYRRYLFVGIVLAIGLLVLLPFTKLGNLAGGYQRRVTSTFQNGNLAVNISDRARIDAAERELEDFLGSNLLIGLGLDYFYIYGAGTDDEDAPHGFGHVGYVTYLSQLGALGFLVYAIWFPWFVLKRARRIHNQEHQTPETKHLTGLAGAYFLLTMIQFTMSNHFLAPDILAGVFAGLVARLYAQQVTTGSTADSDPGAR